MFFLEIAQDMLSYSVRIHSKEPGTENVQEFSLSKTLSKNAKKTIERIAPLKCPLTVKKNGNSLCYGQATITIEVQYEFYKTIQTAYYQVQTSFS